jgi:hypothetical protein
MDEVLLKQLVRQLRILNIWITVFGSLILAVLLVLGYFVFKLVTFVNDTNKKVEHLTTQTRDALDFKSKVCSSDSFGSFLQGRTDLCK